MNHGDDDPRAFLRAAIKKSPFKTAAAVSRQLGGKDFVRDFLAGRKRSLGPRSAELAELLNIDHDRLARGIAGLRRRKAIPPKRQEITMLIEETIRVTAALGYHQWRDRDFRLLAELIQEFFLTVRSSEDDEHRRIRLELDIRRALQRRNP
jgi:hypothetical protein